MAVPTFDQMLRPILALAVQQPITRKQIGEAMADHFGLSPDDREHRIPSGKSTTVRNRAGWAMTFLTKGGLIEKVAPRTYRASERAASFLNEHPSAITVADLKRVPGWQQAWDTGGDDDAPNAPENTAQDRTPLEVLDGSIRTINADLKSRLLQAILDQSSTFFEELVLDVLVAMGYGGSRRDAAQHVGRSGDEGVDGAINQDPLGLDRILVQAKRYAPDRMIDRTTLQAFYGSMTGQGITKGVFITTSSFNVNAREFVTRGTQTKVVLIDGEQLLDLMLRHKIGVRVERQVEVLEIDQNYFSDDE